MRWEVLTFAALALGVASCNHEGTTATSSSVLASGRWGGDHVSLDVTSNSTLIEFDCAHGTVKGPWPLDENGNFDVAGQYVREHGGPIIQGEPEDSQPAQYSGRVDGVNLSFTARLQDGTSLGPFGAVEGQNGRVFKCL